MTNQRLCCSICNRTRKRKKRQTRRGGLGMNKIKKKKEKVKTKLFQMCMLALRWRVNHYTFCDQ